MTDTPRFLGELVDRDRVSRARLEDQGRLNLPEVRCWCDREGAGVSLGAWARAVIDAVPGAFRLTWPELWRMKATAVIVDAGWTEDVVAQIDIFDLRVTPVSLALIARVEVLSARGVDTDDALQVDLWLQLAVAGATAREFEAPRCFHELRRVIVVPGPV
jgi:hypothetical protein